MTRELTQKAQSVRNKRTPLNVRNRLSVKDKDPNYVYRIVNTSDSHGGDRIQDFIEHGYEVVENTKVGDKRVDSSAGLGSASDFSVGKGKKGYILFDGAMPDRWDVMYKFATAVFYNSNDLIKELG